MVPDFKTSGVFNAFCADCSGKADPATSTNTDPPAIALLTPTQSVQSASNPGQSCIGFLSSFGQLSQWGRRIRFWHAKEGDRQPQCSHCSHTWYMADPVGDPFGVWGCDIRCRHGASDQSPKRPTSSEFPCAFFRILFQRLHRHPALSQTAGYPAPEGKTAAHRDGRQ